MDNGSKIDMKKMRIVIYSWTLPKGGLPKVMLKEYHYLLKCDYNVTLATSDPIPDSYEADMKSVNATVLSDLNQEKTTRETDISHYFPGLDLKVKGNFISRTLRLTLYLKSQKTDVVIAHQLLSAILLIPFRLFFSKPYILILHDNPFSFIEPNNYEKLSIVKKITSHFVYYVGVLAIRLSKITVCTTNHIENQLKEHLRETRKVKVADYGFDYFSQENVRSRDIILTVSKWSSFRNPTAYLELLKHLPENVSLTMAGRWDSNEELNEFRKKVNNNGLQGRMIILDNVSEAELENLYRRTRVFIRLGFNEHGTGQAILEAIGHGCPVVVSKGLGASELITDGREGHIVDEKNLQNVAENIMHIYINEHIVTEMSEAAYKLAKNNSWDSYLRKIQDTFI
ncbi:MAG: glycosyltransferase family 4 protein [Thermoplasmatales archaeon]